ncbi:hypothetical protein PGB28_01780 [Primorskyibacter aestuariivivens]|uniref:hypothetical protein n=1 Tax=Primorskyibacter aestuariivivens TaxID=1888912 RepID=UPI002301F944|nr:hypothetical protein [Primorskyibacter aestuariivivens]MDA7427171.1 hypothetical protein [Primorskyibacter aestuariivivens]
MAHGATWTTLALAAALVFSTGETAEAGTVNFSDIDTNGDGVLDQAELDAYFGPMASVMLTKYDMDASGSISLAEIDGKSNQTGFMHSAFGMAKAGANKMAAQQRRQAAQSNGNRGSASASGGGGNRGGGQGGGRGGGQGGGNPNR